MCTKANFTKSLQDRQKYTGLTKVTVPNMTKVPYCKLVKFKQCMYSELIYSYIYILVYWSRSSMCVQCDEKLKRCYLQVFAKSQCCTGYLLIQVQIESVCESHYMYWLVSQSFNRELFLVLGVWLLQCGCRCRCRCRSFCCRCRCRSFCCFCIFHVFFLSFCKIQN